MDFQLTTILLVGAAVSIGLYTGRLARRVGLPSLIGYMLLGALMGSSVLDLFSAEVLRSLSFVTDIALGFVAFSIGSELNIASLRKLGRGITSILILETTITFLFVTAAVLLVTGDWPFALIFGAMAPATAPAGTVAVIQEYRARGNLTQALYAVVGFDDGIAVLIFGFAAAASESLLASETGSSPHILRTALEPVLEILASIASGLLLGYIYTRLVTRIRSRDDLPALTFGFVCLSVGLALSLGFSPILTPMAVGFTLANTSRRETGTVAASLRSLMPLVFVLFFFIAGTHLQLDSLHSLGLLGLTYILARSLGKITGAGLGARLGGASPVLRKYLGIALLSQAGVAIGLSLAAASHFARLGEHGSSIAAAVITTVTATSVVFEIIGPITAKIALRKAGEIQD